MIQAIIFDCFGVLATDGWLPFKREHFGDSRERYEAVTDLNKQANAGMLSHEAFITKIAQLAQVSEHEAEKAISDNAPNGELFAYIQELKPDYKIGLLSNTASDQLEKLFSRDQRDLFDVIALSYDTGHVKPQEKAYTTVAEQLGVQVDECVFIDDQERLVTGAKEAGMQAVVYSDVSSLRRDLTRILGDTED